MKRRELLIGAGTLAVASATVGAPGAEAAERGGLATAVSGCLEAGEACLAHCHMLLAGGDASLAACAKTVSDMLAVDAALLRLTSTASSHLGALAAVAVAVSRDCEAECRKHEATHAVCKACADSCARVIAEAGKLAG